MKYETKDYVEILKAVLNMALFEIENDDRYELDDYIQGQAAGIRTALWKIEKSKFLYE